MKIKMWIGFILLSVFSLCTEAKAVHVAVAATGEEIAVKDHDQAKPFESIDAAV